MGQRRGFHQMFLIILTLILAAMFGAFLFISEYRDNQKSEEIRQMQKNHRKEQDIKKEELSFQLLKNDTWEKNKLAKEKVILDTDTLLEEASLNSALYSNASVSWMGDGSFGDYVWRFSIKTESSAKTIKIFDGSEITEYTVYPQETLFYIPAAGNRFKIELEGGRDAFECLSIRDIQLVNPTEHTALNGQYLTAGDSEGIVNEIGYSADRISSAPGAEKEESSGLKMPGWIRINGEKWAAELCFEFNEVNTDEKTLLLGFAVNSSNASGAMSVRAGDSYQAARFVNPQTQEYIFPLRNIGNVSECRVAVELPVCGDPCHLGNSALNGVLNISALSVYTTDEADGTTLPGGSYMLADYEEITFDTSQDTLPIMTDSFVLGDFLYGVGGGQLLIYDIKDNASKPKQAAELGGLGNTREIVPVAGGTAVAVSARENGVWLIDVTEPSNPQIRSHYDSLEFATGIYGYGDYLAVCSRYWGVELLDISDLANPEWCSTVSSQSEYYDCCIYEGYLYVSVWAQKRVDVYDLANVYEPERIASINLDGNGGGIAACDGLLYIATGYNGAGNSEDAFSASFGTGNGLEIYDISDPRGIQWLSASKIDGRYYIAGYDHWDITVSGGRAYLSSAANGLYIYDVSDPSAPIRTTRIRGGGYKPSSQYENLSNNYILPDGPKGAGREIITGVALADGYIYLTGYLDGTFIYENSDAAANAQETSESLSGSKQEESHKIRAGRYETLQYTSGTSIYATTSSDGRIYTACGRGGIAVLDENLQELYTLDTEGIVRDLLVRNGLLYAAESEEGLGIYKISDSGLEEIGRFKPGDTNFTFSSLEMLSDQRILVQGGYSRLYMIDVSDPAAPAAFSSEPPGNQSVGSMYGRNICAGPVHTGEGNLVGAAGAGKINWYKPDGSLFSSMENSIINESDGAASAGELAVAIHNNGYVYYDPAATKEEDLENLPFGKIDQVVLRGKPVIKGDLMVVSWGYGRKIFLADISDLGAPRLLQSIEVNGNPDTAEITDDAILVPLRNEGLLMIRMPDSVSL